MANSVQLRPDQKLATKICSCSPTTGHSYWYEEYEDETKKKKTKLLCTRGTRVNPKEILIAIAQDMHICHGIQSPHKTKKRE